MRLLRSRREHQVAAVASGTEKCCLTICIRERAEWKKAIARRNRKLLRERMNFSSVACKESLSILFALSSSPSLRLLSPPSSGVILFPPTSLSDAFASEVESVGETKRRLRYTCRLEADASYALFRSRPLSPFNYSFSQLRHSLGRKRSAKGAPR